MFAAESICLSFGAKWSISLNDFLTRAESVSLNIQISSDKIDFNISRIRVRRGLKWRLRLKFHEWGSHKEHASERCVYEWNLFFFIRLKKHKKISREATQRNRQRNNQQIVHNRGVGVTSCFFSVADFAASWNPTNSLFKYFIKRLFRFMTDGNLFTKSREKTHARINNAIFWMIFRQRKWRK